MAKKKNNFSLPYSADRVNSLFNELPADLSDDYYTLIVHNVDKSKLFSSAYSKDSLAVSNLDILINCEDAEKLVTGRLHGRNTYNNILPHTHNIDMCLAVAIPIGTPFAVYTENISTDSSGNIPERQFTVFNKNHKQIGTYDASNPESFDKLTQVLDKDMSPLLSDTSDTLKYSYYPIKHPDVMDKIVSNSQKFSDSNVKNNFYARRAMNIVVNRFMPELKSINIFKVDAENHQRLADFTRVLIDSESENYNKLREERYSIPKTAQAEIKKNAEAFIKYDEIIASRCQREVKLLDNPKATQSEVHKFFENELSATGITEKELFDIDQKAVEAYGTDKNTNKAHITSSKKTVNVADIASKGSNITTVEKDDVTSEHVQDN